MGRNPRKADDQKPAAPPEIVHVSRDLWTDITLVMRALYVNGGTLIRRVGMDDERVIPEIVYRQAEELHHKLQTIKAPETCGKEG